MNRLKNLPPLCPEPVDLGNGVILRRAEPADKKALINFNGIVHGSKPLVGGLTQSSLDADLDESVKHPSLSHACFTVVVDTKQKTPLTAGTEGGMDDSGFVTTDGLIISSIMSIPQIWMYGETDGSFLLDSAPSPARVPLLVIRPEAIGTHPSHRSKGLVEKQMDVHHKWANDMNAEASFILGIPGYYRKFGYEPTVEVYWGRSGDLATIPKLGSDEREKYVLRDASVDDAGFVAKVDRVNSIRRRNIAADLDEASWRNQIGGRNVAGSLNKRDVYVIEEAEGDGKGKPIGFIQINAINRIIRYEIDPSSRHSWAAVTPSLLRWIPKRDLKLLQAKAPETTSLPSDYTFTIAISKDHPIFKTIPVNNHLPKLFPPFKVYTRIMNVPRFLEAIKPVLNARLKSDPCWHNYSGQLAILGNPVEASSKGGCIIHIAEGSIEKVERAARGETLQSLAKSAVNVFCPVGGLLIYNVLFGAMTASKLVETYRGDVYVQGSAALLMDALFPPIQSGEIVPLD
ncbi:hypothetical protein HDU97_006613 [Phlyctochytrium planicorne]|nr:hypothetical protein HDU97_006613 [Phlyctochytrium planicorne]